MMVACKSAAGGRVEGGEVKGQLGQLELNAPCCEAGWHKREGD